MASPSHTHTILLLFVTLQMQTDVLGQRQKDCRPSFTFSAHFVPFCFGKDLLRTSQKLTWRQQRCSENTPEQTLLWVISTHHNCSGVITWERASHPPTKDTFSANARCMLQHALLRVCCSYGLLFSLLQRKSSRNPSLLRECPAPVQFHPSFWNKRESSGSSMPSQQMHSFQQPKCVCFNHTANSHSQWRCPFSVSVQNLWQIHVLLGWTKALQALKYCSSLTNKTTTKE